MSRSTGRRTKNHFPIVLEAEVYGGMGWDSCGVKAGGGRERKLKQLGADLSLDKHILQEVVQKEL
jgi:hypothetical protein